MAQTVIWLQGKIMTESTKKPTARSIEILNTLRTVAAETLEKKRRLGQYAVIWDNNKPVLIGDDKPKD